MNINAVGLRTDQVTEDMVLLFETKPGWNQIGGLELLATDNHLKSDHGRKGANVAFGDGHVEFIKAEDLSKLRWDVE